MARPRQPPVRIVVDVQEKRSGIAATLEELGAEVEIASLPAGDYACGEDTLVERKRVRTRRRKQRLGGGGATAARLRSGSPSRC